MKDVKGSQSAKIEFDGTNTDECIVAIDEYLRAGTMPTLLLAERITSCRAFDDRTDREIANTLNRVDKELWSRSIARSHLDGCLNDYAIRRCRRRLTPIHWSQVIHEVRYEQLFRLLPILNDRAGYRSVYVECSDASVAKRLHQDGYLSAQNRLVGPFPGGRGAPVDQEIRLATLVDVHKVRSLLTDGHLELSESHRSPRISLRVENSALEVWNELIETLVSVGRKKCEIFLNIPFWDGEGGMTALDWRLAVDSLREACLQNDGRLSSGVLELTTIGLEASEQYPEILSRHISDSGCVSISVVAALYNAGQFIDDFVRSLSSQLCCEPFEIVLVDDGSDDDTWRRLEVFFDTYRGQMNIQLIRLSRQCRYTPGTFSFRAGAARQKGCECARADRLLFLDSDQTVDPLCVAEHLEMGRIGFDVVVGARYSPEAPICDRIKSRIRHISETAPAGDWWPIFFTGNSSVSREAFEAVGGFDEVLQYWGLDDRDLGYRLYRAGAYCWHTPRARVTHVAVAESGGASSEMSRARSCRFQMEVLYRKYLDGYILDAYRPFWVSVQSSPLD